jgi:hypothetical protein
MGVVAGADEAEQTRQAAAQKPQTAAQTARAPAQEQAPAQTTPGVPQDVAPAAERSSAATNHVARSAAKQAPENESPTEQVPPTPGFGERGRMRRRARFLRKARELAYRDLGGLVFDLHRFGQRNDPLVLAKLATLREIDTELRGLEDGLRDHRPVTVLREVGIAACPRCAAIHGSDDRFCPGCGLAFDVNADRPISTAPVALKAHEPPAQAQPPIATPSPVTAPAAAPAAAAPPAVTAPAAAPPAVTAPAAAPPAVTPPAVTPPAVTARPVTPPERTAPPGRSPAGTPPSSASARASASASPPRPNAPAVAAPTAPTPSAAKPASAPPASKPASAPPASEPKVPERAQEDEPTQILRPPRGDTST